VSTQAGREQTLVVAVLLSSAGGALDAFAWIAHGHVFANAQTGNIVLLGVSAATGDWVQAARHLPPIGAFFLGVLAAHLLGRLDRRAALISLCIEIALLGLVMVLPRGVPDLPIIVGVAFVAALQNASFDRVRGWTFNSVMTTGNLRRTAGALFAGVLPQPGASMLDRAASLREARSFAFICAGFCVGSALGGLATLRFDDAGLLFPIALLAAVLGWCLRPA
jgi:uncharacterized membrane protein YoaK (UPF0700 family)